jgi:hypothetical protein
MLTPMNSSNKEVECYAMLCYALNVDGVAEDILSVEVTMLCFKPLTIQNELMDQVAEPLRNVTDSNMYYPFYAAIYAIFVFEIM